MSRIYCPAHYQALALLEPFFLCFADFVVDSLSQEIILLIIYSIPTPQLSVIPSAQGAVTTCECDFPTVNHPPLLSPSNGALIIMDNNLINYSTQTIEFGSLIAYLPPQSFHVPIIIQEVALPHIVARCAFNYHFSSSAPIRSTQGERVESAKLCFDILGLPSRAPRTKDLGLQFIFSSGSNAWLTTISANHSNHPTRSQLAWDGFPRIVLT